MPPTFTDRIDSRDAWIGRAAAAWTSTSAPSTSAAHVLRGADVAAQLLHRSARARLVERREVERPHLVAVGEQPPREVQAEEPGPSGDRPAHRQEATGEPDERLRRLPGTGFGGGFESTRIAARSRIDTATAASPTRLFGSRRCDGRPVEPRPDDEVVEGAPRERQADERELDEQQLPVPDRPEVVERPGTA